MILVDYRAVNAKLQAALTSLRCWVGPIAVWQHPYDHPDTSLQTPSSQHYAYIEGDTLEAATHAFAQQQHSEVSLVVVRTEHAGECNRGILAIDGSESEELLHAQIVQQLVSICRHHCPGVVTVATIMKQSRQEALCSQGLLHMHPVDGVCYFPMRADTTPHLQPPHNALLVKATDFLERREDPHGGLAVAVSEQVLRVMRTAEADGKAVLDPLRALEAVLDRRTLRRRLPDLQESTSDLVVWSECLKVQDRRAAEAKAGAMRSMLEGCDGLLCKPCVACGIPESHEMCLVRHPAALPPDMPVCPFIVESVHNHSGVVFKCYVIQERVFVHARPSLPDWPDPRRPWQAPHAERSWRFHSITGMPCADGDGIDLSVPATAPVRAAAARCARVLADETRLKLFGFDLVKPTEMDCFVLVDVNAFPSFKGAVGAPEALRAAVVTCAGHPGGPVSVV